MKGMTALQTREELVARIKALKEERDAVILAHFYVDDEVQDIADYTGDSYNLSKLAADLDNRTIVFAGVQFMGESAKLLSPDKTVILPNPQADCPMAHMVSKEVIDAAREAYDDLAVVCYVNSTAQIKSWSDVCVTSSNALKICQSLPQKNILFIPDQNLGRYIASLIPEKHFIFNEGCCPIHQDISPEEVRALKAQYPNAPILAHPECNAQICELADYLGSTSGIIERVVTGKESDFIICTVVGVACEIKKRLAAQQTADQDSPSKRLHFPATTPRCKDMDSITLEQIAEALSDMSDTVELDMSCAPAARSTLTRMLELSV
jgi:quinolinate synthase